MLRGRTPALLWIATLAACGAEPGYSPDHPGQVVCGCHDAASCYDGAAELASREGENAETAERLLYFAQCACFQGGTAGCNTLGHFTRDWVTACSHGEDIATSCTIAGFVWYHGVQLPRISGPSIERDPAAAMQAFHRACGAGSRVACDHAR